MRGRGVCGLLGFVGCWEGAGCVFLPRCELDTGAREDLWVCLTLTIYLVLNIFSLPSCSDIRDGCHHSCGSSLQSPSPSSVLLLPSRKAKAGESEGEFFVIHHL